MSVVFLFIIFSLIILYLEVIILSFHNNCNSCNTYIMNDDVECFEYELRKIIKKSDAQNIIIIDKSNSREIRKILELLKKDYTFLSVNEKNTD